MIFIRRGILQSELTGVDASLKGALKSELSYANKSQIIARAIAKKKLGYIPKKLSWDGMTYLINSKDQFDSGLLKRVIALLDSRGEAYTFLPEKEMPEGHPLKMKVPLELWSHQREAVEAIKKNVTGIVRIGTGGGKTKLSVVACSEIGQFPFLFVVNRITLLNQTHDDYVKYFGEAVGYLGDGRVEVEPKINIASINTLCSMLKIKLTDGDDDEKLNYSPEQIEAAKALLKATRMVIIDECHHAAAGTYKTLLGALPNAFYRIGLSATPFRTDGADILLTAAFGEEIYVKSASELIREGVLAKPKIYMVQYKDPLLTKQFPKNMKPSPNFATVYKQCTVENERFNTIVAECAAVNAKMDRLTLVSVKQIKHGETIFNIMKKIAPNVTCEFLHGKNKAVLNEDKIKQEFTDGKIKVLISTLFDEGVDIPKIDAIIDAGGGRSAIKALQLVGRGIRKYPGKTKAFIYMFIQPYAHLYKHSIERCAILQTEEEFNIQVMDWQG
jgi:superfamily II DNA or RNA helicase